MTDLLMLNWGIKDPNSLVFSSESLGKSSAGRRQSWKELKYFFERFKFLDRTYAPWQASFFVDPTVLFWWGENNPCTENFCVCAILLFFSELCEWLWVKVVGGKSWGKLGAIMEKIRQRQQEERRSPLGKLIKSPSEQNVLYWHNTKPNIPAL